MDVIIAENLVKEFPTRAEPVSVLGGVSLRLSAGDNLAIVGPSGSGKSTLLHILGTLDRPTSGSILLDGHDPFQWKEPELADFRNRKIGFVFQEHHLLEQCTAWENILLPTLAAGRPSVEDLAWAKTLIERVGLSRRSDHRPAELSGGERQRVAIARALIHRPALLLADEPTGNLDHATATDVADLLLDLQRQEKTAMVVVTHSLELADRLDRIARLDAGTLQMS